jgi:hypothetical protein
MDMTLDQANVDHPWLGATAYRNRFANYRVVPAASIHRSTVHRAAAIIPGCAGSLQRIPAPEGISFGRRFQARPETQGCGETAFDYAGRICPAARILNILSAGPKVAAKSVVILVRPCAPSSALQKKFQRGRHSLGSVEERSFQEA